MKEPINAGQKVDRYMTNISDDLKPICEGLRTIFLDEGLIEDFKWGVPCYGHMGLVCSIGAFKKHVGTWFFKGSLLTDPNGALRQAQKTTKALRSLTFEKLEDLDPEQLRLFVKEAMLLNEKGIKVNTKISRKLEIPAYFKTELDRNSKAKETFENFTYSKKKEYIDWITTAKREQTRTDRVKESVQMLAAGKGKHDKYRK